MIVRALRLVVAFAAAWLCAPVSGAAWTLENHSVHEAWASGQAVSGMGEARLYRAQTRELIDVARNAMLAIDNDLSTCGELHATLAFPTTPDELASLPSLYATYRGQARLDRGGWLGFTGRMHIIEGMPEQYFQIERWSSDAAEQFIQQGGQAEIAEFRLFMSEQYAPVFTFPMMGFAAAVNTMVAHCRSDRQRPARQRFDESHGFLTARELQAQQDLFRLE